MGIFDIFSKREARESGQLPDVYTYDDIPNKVRIQLLHIVRDALGDPNAYGSHTAALYKSIHDGLAREYGMLELSSGSSRGTDQAIAGVWEFLVDIATTEQVLDVMELVLRLAVDNQGDWQFEHHCEPKIKGTDAVAEVNFRLKEAGIGYRYEDRQFIRVDSEFVHQEIVRPALQVLQERSFAGANAEFLSAHEHYRHGRYKECLNNCLKAFESTMKVICKDRSWSVRGPETARNLLNTIFQNELIPAYLQSEFSALRSSLESGVPTVRNRQSGHGQGDVIITVPEYIAQYILQMTAVSITFLAAAHKEG